MYESESKTKRAAPGTYAVSVLLGIFSAALLLLAAAMLFGTGKLGEESTEEIIIAVNFAAAAVAGIAAAARKSGGEALKSGAVAGMIICVLLLAAGLIVRGGTLPGREAARIAVCSVCGGLFGGALCLKRGNKKLHKKRNQKRR
jgi:putative membrane protein (TIGR04086 family)